MDSSSAYLFVGLMLALVGGGCVVWWFWPWLLLSLTFGSLSLPTFLFFALCVCLTWFIYCKCVSCVEMLRTGLRSVTSTSFRVLDSVNTSISMLCDFSHSYLPKEEMMLAGVASLLISRSLLESKKTKGNVTKVLDGLVSITILIGIMIGFSEPHKGLRAWNQYFQSIRLLAGAFGIIHLFFGAFVPTSDVPKIAAVGEMIAEKAANFEAKVCQSGKGESVVNLDAEMSDLNIGSSARTCISNMMRDVKNLKPSWTERLWSLRSSEGSGIGYHQYHRQLRVGACCIIFTIALLFVRAKWFRKNVSKVVDEPVKIPESSVVTRVHVNPITKKPLLEVVPEFETCAIVDDKKNVVFNCIAGDSLVLESGKRRKVEAVNVVKKPEARTYKNAKMEWWYNPSTRSWEMVTDRNREEAYEVIQGENYEFDALPDFATMSSSEQFRFKANEEMAESSYDRLVTLEDPLDDWIRHGGNLLSDHIRAQYHELLRMITDLDICDRKWKSLKNGVPPVGMAWRKHMADFRTLAEQVGSKIHSLSVKTNEAMVPVVPSSNSSFSVSSGAESSLPKLSELSWQPVVVQPSLFKASEAQFAVSPVVVKSDAPKLEAKQSDTTSGVPKVDETKVRWADVVDSKEPSSQPFEEKKSKKKLKREKKLLKEKAQEALVVPASASLVLSPPNTKVLEASFSNSTVLPSSFYNKCVFRLEVTSAEGVTPLWATLVAGYFVSVKHAFVGATTSHLHFIDGSEKFKLEIPIDQWEMHQHTRQIRNRETGEVKLGQTYSLDLARLPAPFVHAKLGPENVKKYLNSPQRFHICSDFYGGQVAYVNGESCSTGTANIVQNECHHTCTTSVGECGGVIVLVDGNRRPTGSVVGLHYAGGAEKSGQPNYAHSFWELRHWLQP